MIRINKITIIALIASTLSLQGDIGVDSVGFHVGKGITDHDYENKRSKVIPSASPMENYKGLEIFGTFKGLFDEDFLKPSISYTFTNNEDLDHQYILLGLNKYIDINNFNLYGGVVAGIGQIKWGYNPLNNSKENDYQTHSTMIGIQAGMEYPMTDKLFLGINSKYLIHKYETDLVPSDNVHSEFQHDRTIFMGLGITYKFNEEKRKVAPKSDDLKKEKTIKEKPKDSDQDGILDKDDQCLNTFAGAKVDKNGCEKDQDKDGIVDRLDQCTNTHEGAKVDKNGCELDSDNDGVVDRLDQCPNSFKGEKVDSVGCGITFTIRINFPTDSAIINSSYKEKIEELATFLLSYSSYNVIIEAHTDSRGSDEYNMKLSLDRAKALYNELIKLGISNARMSYSGVGEQLPIASNDTEEGRAENRRIEVTFIHNHK